MGDGLTDRIEEIIGRRANHIHPDIAIESVVLPQDNGHYRENAGWRCCLSHSVSARKRSQTCARTISSCSRATATRPADEALVRRRHAAARRLQARQGGRRAPPRRRAGTAHELPGLWRSRPALQLLRASFRVVASRPRVVPAMSDNGRAVAPPSPILRPSSLPLGDELRAYRPSERLTVASAMRATPPRLVGARDAWSSSEGGRTAGVRARPGATSYAHAAAPATHPASCRALKQRDRGLQRPVRRLAAGASGISRATVAGPARTRRSTSFRSAYRCFPCMRTMRRSCRTPAAHSCSRLSKRTSTSSNVRRCSGRESRHAKPSATGPRLRSCLSAAGGPDGSGQRPPSLAQSGLK